LIYCTADTKATPAPVQVVGVDFQIFMISLLHNVVKRVLNKHAQFRCVFGSRDSPLKLDVHCAYGSAHTSLILIMLSLPVYYLIRGGILLGFGEFMFGYLG
jgi:hypothetical protein